METTTKKYTCIKTTTHKHQKVSVGDEIELTPEQARPLSHGGFITLDEDAAKCIRELANENKQHGESDDNGTSVTDESIDDDTQVSHSHQSIGYEKGD